MGTIKYAIVLTGFLLLSGCFPHTQSLPRVIQYYAPEFRPSPSPRSKVDTVVGIGRFPAAQAYNNTAMVYQPEPYRLASYSYHRWSTNPGDMVHEYLLRDFRETGVFKAVFSYREAEISRFILSGNIEEFLETREGEKRHAVLSVQVKLIDNGITVRGESIVFQKRYRTSEPVDGNSPASLVAGMSRALARVSKEILDDVHGAVSAATAQEHGHNGTHGKN